MISPRDPNAPRMEQPGYNAMGTNGNYTRKILDRVGAGLGEAHATIAAAKKLTRTTAEIGLEEPNNERRVFTLDGITNGLGLDAADAQRIQQLVTDTSASFDSKSYPKLTQAIAKITMALRRSWHIPSATRGEIAKRVRSYYQNTQTTDYGAKAPSLRYTPNGVAEKTTEQPMRKANPRLVIKKAVPDPMRPPQGFMPVPKSKKGGWKSPDGKAYWYPDGKGVRSAPEEGGASAGGEHPDDKPVNMGAYQGPQGGQDAMARQGSKVTAPPGAPPPAGGGMKAKPKLGVIPGSKGASAGAQGQGGGKHEASHAFAFAGAPEGSDHDATELHHRAELTKVKHLLKQAREAGDQEAVQKLMAIGKQHQDAGNAAIRAGAEKFAQGGPSQVGQGQQPSPEEGQEGGEEEAPEGETPPTEQAPQNGAQGQPPPSSGTMQGGDEGETGLPGEEELAADPRKGLERTSSGVTTDEHGNRVTAATPKPRAIPEAAIVGEMRQRLGRAVNVMSDLSAAHDDLATQKQNLSKWKASGHPATKQAVATIRAQVAQTQADIAQLEAAHAEAMKDVNEAQAKMREAKIRESPIFQAFMGVMGKIGEVGGKVGAAVQDVKDTRASQAASKQGLADTQRVLSEHIASTDEQGNTLKPQAAGEGVSAKKKKQFGAFENPTLNPQQKQAEDVLSRLAAQDDIAPDVEELSSEDVYELGEGEEELSPQEREIAQRLKANPAKIEGPEAAQRAEAENKRSREIVDRLEAEGRFGGPDRDLTGGHEDSGVRVKGANDEKATESPIARKRRLVEEAKRKAADQKGTVKLAKSQRRRVVPMSAIVKSEAWRIAIDLGMQANADIRKSYPGPKLVILTKAAPRVPYFFNDL